MNEVVFDIIHNAWNWGLREFAEKLGKVPATPQIQQEFLAFQKVADELRKLPNDVLELICAKDKV